MDRYRVWLLLAVVCISVPLLTARAGAWEFTMSGAFTWELEGRTQGGSDGFFGKYDSAMFPGALAPAARNFGGVYAPYNAWLGYNGVGIVSGSDGTWNTQYMGTDMQLRINKAIRIRGLYYIGEWGAGGTANQVASEYLTERFPGIQRSFSPGYWNTLWMAAELPWGVLTVGKRPSSFGTGLGWNGADSRDSQSFSLTVPYGPLRIGMSIYPSRRASSTAYYNVDYDKNNTRIWDIGVGTLTYRSGPCDLGVVLNLGANSHQGGERSLVIPATRQTSTMQDRSDFYGGGYFKYYNGRIFFNAETDFYTITNRNRKKTAGNAPAPGTRDTYLEHWRWMAEMHALAGPAKVSLMYAWSAGDDRRGWQFNGAGAQLQGNVTLTDKAYVLNNNSFSNTGLFRPYSYLMVYGYGLGRFVNPDSNNGFVEDASVFAGRVDYSVAANLNLFGTFFYANRASSSGSGWGCLVPNDAISAAAGLSGSANGVTYRERVGAPNIPDNGLGYEIDAGFTWRLLEGLTVNTTFAYWQPGDWFKWACVDKNVPAWSTVGVVGSTLPANWGINPDRGISPIYGMELTLKGEF
jgi:hypothetical protein